LLRGNPYYKTVKGNKMNYNKTYRKFKRNSKALSPVVASIILIAVTVAVSVVVAAWMSGSIFGLMGTTEQATITNVQLVAGASSVIATVQNTGDTPITLNAASINGQVATIASSTINGTDAGTTTPTFTKADSVQVTLTNPSGITLNSGDTYQVKLGTTKGNNLVYTQVCP
jgi:flagellin-like protein